MKKPNQLLHWLGHLHDWYNQSGRRTGFISTQPSILWIHISPYAKHLRIKPHKLHKIKIVYIMIKIRCVKGTYMAIWLYNIYFCNNHDKVRLLIVLDKYILWSPLHVTLLQSIITSVTRVPKGFKLSTQRFTFLHYNLNQLKNVAFSLVNVTWSDLWDSESSKDRIKCLPGPGA